MSASVSLPAWAASHHVERRPEPLAESAPLAADWALGHCRIDPATGESCRGYHERWQQRRLEGRDLGFGNDGPVVASLLRGLGRRGDARRVLVCGSADYGLLAMVADALDGCPAPSVTVLDRCETPLMLNRWFAARRSLPIETVRGDALEHRPAQPYDLILVHTLLGFFDDADRHRLIAAWRDALAPGGRVLLSHPLAGGAGPSSADPRARAADARFVADWHRNAAKSQFKAKSQRDLSTLFSGAGFEIEAAIEVRRPGKPPGGLRGLWRRLTRAAERPRPRGRDYAVVLARRPAA